MTRKEAIDLFGGNVTKMAELLHMPRTKIYRWPREGQLPQAIEDQVRGAYARVCEERDKLLVHRIGDE